MTISVWTKESGLCTDEVVAMCVVLSQPERGEVSVFSDVVTMAATLPSFPAFLEPPAFMGGRTDPNSNPLDLILDYCSLQPI